MKPVRKETRSTHISTALKVGGVLLEAAAVLLVVVMLLEGVSRLMHGGVRQMLPYVADDSLSPRMPSEFESKVQFSGSPTFTVCTDEYGLRGNQCGFRQAPPRVLTVGDSQAFGWAMDFSESFTTKVAEALGERGPEAARAMAAGGADVESLLGWVRDYRNHLPSPQPPGRLNIVMVNLGNDLDEMYYGRASGQMPLMKAAREWLAVHSYFMLDFNLLKTKLLPSTEWQLPPGTNPVVLALTTTEREKLALGTADAALRLVRELPPTEQSVVVLLPNDYQVAKSEFAKYRPFYRTQEQFDGWQKRVDSSVANLNEIEQQIARALQREGVAVVTPRQRLAAYNPLQIFDRKSHHYTVFGQTVLAASVLEAIGYPSAQIALPPATKTPQ